MCIFPIFLRGNMSNKVYLQNYNSFFIINYQKKYLVKREWLIKSDIHGK